MRSRSRRTLTVAIGSLILVAVVFAGSDVCESCEHAEQTNGWCDVCGVGYVGGVRIESSRLWHTLDAHGHSLNLDSLGCAECSEAAASDGFCEKSRIGFIDGSAYFSRLTWLLAKAEIVDPDALECADCRDHSSHGGWCETCQIGIAGRYFLRDRTDFDHLLHDLEILELANREAPRCDRCSAAIVTDTECPICRITYKDGKPVD